MFRVVFLCLSLCICHLGCTNAIQFDTRNNYSVNLFEERDPGSDPTDLSWIKSWAAVGDSFSAGIGSGSVLKGATDIQCSRYDYSWPSILRKVIGPGSSWSYTACSGDTSVQVYDQINKLSGGLDLLVLTSGGNDLCLTDIIGKCILAASYNPGSCQSAMNTAQNAINTIFPNNVNEIIKAIDAKMNKGGIVVWALYGQYFNQDAVEPCTSQQDWTFPIPGPGNALTTSNRAAMNTLVGNTNTVIKNAIQNAGSITSRAKYVTADWDPFVGKLDGRFCNPGSSPYPDDPSNNNVQFFKLATPKIATPSERKLRMRDSLYPFEPFSLNISTAVEKSNDGRALFGHLEERDPSPGACGGSGGGSSLPDSIGKIFHPNQGGHESIAAFVLGAIDSARASVIGQPDPICAATSSVVCYGKQGSKGYATAYALYSNVADFCHSAAGAPPSQGNTFSKTYNQGSVDENTFSVKLLNSGGTFSELACNNAVESILNLCDKSDSNPMNWKQGGYVIEGSWEYTIGITRTNRPWPLPTAPQQTCHGQYYGIFSGYTIQGGGWASWDFGQQTLMGNITSCIGHGGLTGWTFKYFDSPQGGMEWESYFHTPIWTQARCFNNNKVTGGAGGPGPGGGGCHGSG